MSVCPLYFSVAQLCLTVCDPMDCSPPGSSVHGILQSRILEWVAMPFSRGSSSPRVGTCCLLQWQADSLPLSHLGSPCLGKDGQREAVRLSPFTRWCFPAGTLVSWAALPTGGDSLGSSLLFCWCLMSCEYSRVLNCVQLGALWEVYKVPECSGVDRAMSGSQQKGNVYPK